MAYPGNLELSSQAQERVVTAFRQVVTKLQDGQREEALIGLEFVLRLDPDFRPAVNLHKQLSSGAAEIDLSEIISQLQAPTTDALNMLLVEAVEAFNQREFASAQHKVEQVLLDLPGHPEARQLLSQIRDSLKVDGQVTQFLGQARAALDEGDPQEAANFVMMAQALDPHHPGIEGALQDIYAAGGPPRDASVGDPVQFDQVADDHGPAFTVEFDPPETRAAPAGGSSLWDEPEDDQPDHGAGDDDDPLGDEGDIADLFEAEPEETTPDEDAAAGALDEDERRRVDDLLEQGENALAGDDVLGAIDIWSRIFLIDPEHRRARDRIADATARAEELERRVEHMLFDARDAVVAGDRDGARRMLDEIRRIAPHSLEAEDLRLRLAEQPEPDAGADPTLEPPPAPEMPDLEDDLFREDLPPTADLGAMALDLHEPSAGGEAPPRPVLRRRTVPWRIVAAVAAAIGIILLGVWLGSLVLGSRSSEDATEVLNRLLAEAETLYQQRRVEEAALLLRQFEPASDLDRARIERRLAKYEAELAPPTPTPVPVSLITARQLLDEGRWFAAYQHVTEGLERHPSDAGLAALREEILDIEPDAAAVGSALADDNFRAAAVVLTDLAEQYPDQQEIGPALERSLYNAALAELRVYNLTGAEGLLRRLEQRTPGDREVERILEFIEQYKTRPVDMRLQIFIKNLDPR